jgi:hypothetical protein
VGNLEMTNIKSMLDGINEEVDANTKIIIAEIPGGLPIEDRINSIKNSPEATRAQLRNKLLLVRKLELEARLYDITIELGYKEAK